MALRGKRPYMRETRPYRENNCIKTHMMFCETRSDLVSYLSTYGDDLYVVSDPETASLFPRGLSRLETNFIAAWDAEQNDLSVVSGIMTRAHELGVRPDTRWLIIGNEGTINIALLASSLYYGGAKVTVVPTTLFSMVSETIGGRCGINYPGERFLCSTTYPADEIIFDSVFLARQSEEDIRNGFGELMRYAFLSRDSSLMDFLLENVDGLRHRNLDLLSAMVEMAISVKIDYLEAGKKAGALLKVLDFGRRFSWGFSLEAHQRLHYGNSLVWGMARAIALGVQNGITDPAYARKAMELIRIYSYDVSLKLPRQSVLRYSEASFASHDGKSCEMILPRKQGDFVLAKLPLDVLMRILS